MTDTLTTETTEETVVEPTEIVDVTAAPDTEITETTADQETSTTSPKPEAQETADTQKDNETTPEGEVARVVPDVADYVLPEGVPIEMAQFANEHDFTQEQLDATMTQFGAIVNANKQAELQVMRDSGEDLVKSWGKQKDYNMSLVTRALKQNDPEGELSKVLDISGFGNHPAVLNFFLSIGNSMKEGGFLKGSMNTPKGTGGTTAANAMFGANHPSTN